MQIPKYYLKPFWQANDTAQINKKNWNELRKANNVPIKDEADDVPSYYFLQDPQLAWMAWNIPVCGLTKRLEMEEKNAKRKK